MFKIQLLVWSEDSELHIRARNGVSVAEAEEAVYNHGLAIRGRSRGVYEIFGKSDPGRYLLVVVRYCGGGMAMVITARDMTGTERRRYRRLRMH